MSSLVTSKDAEGEGALTRDHAADHGRSQRTHGARIKSRFMNDAFQMPAGALILVAGRSGWLPRQDAAFDSTSQPSEGAGMQEVVVSSRLPAYHHG